jgi:hypothetical protein
MHLFSFSVYIREQAGRQADRQAGRQAGRQACRQADRQTGRQAGRQAGRQGRQAEAGRQAGRQAGCGWNNDGSSEMYRYAPSASAEDHAVTCLMPVPVPVPVPVHDACLHITTLVSSRTLQMPGVPSHSGDSLRVRE